MILRIERGKGGRDRYAMLSADLLDLLRRWWSEGHGRVSCSVRAGCSRGRMGTADQHTPASSRRRRGGARGRDLQARRSPYPAPLLATHLLEDGVDIRVIQVLLGHSRLDTTALYAKVATRTVRAITSPLDRLALFHRQGPAPG